MPAATHLVSGRMIVRATIALLAGCLLILATGSTRANAEAACPGSDAAPSAQNLAVAAGAVVCLVNAERARHGRPALTGNANLGHAAGLHSRDMVRRAFFAHMTPTGSGPNARVRRSGYMHGTLDWTVGEDIAWGTGALSTPGATVAGWIASPAHERVILGAFREAGVGIALGVPMAAGAAAGATYTLDVGQAGR